MLRPRTRYRIGAALFVLALVWVAAFGAYSGLQSCATFRNPETNASSNKANQETPTPYQPYESFWHRAVTDPIVIFTFALAVFTASLAYSTFKLARATRDEFMATHRPKIIIHTCEVAHDVDGSICAEFVIVNEGVNPATILDVATRIFMTGELRPGTALNHNQFTGKELIAGAKMSWGAKGFPMVSVVATDINKAATDPKLWLIGQITYADSRGRTRETGFCRFYDRSKILWVREANSDYEYAY